MHISHRHGFVFLATPHAASTSIGALLAPHSDIASVHSSVITPEMPFFHHINARQARAQFERFGWRWAEYRHFCMVRNPYDRVVSLYHFNQKFQWQREQSPVANLRRYVGRKRRVRGSFPVLSGA